MRKSAYWPCVWLLCSCSAAENEDVFTSGTPGLGSATDSLDRDEGGESEATESDGLDDDGAELTSDGTGPWMPMFDLGPDAPDVPDGGTGGTECPTPQLVIALDRSFSMRRKPSGEDAGTNVAKTKWAHAITAVETFSAHYDSSIEIGLELFPSPPNGDFCAKFEKIQQMDFEGELCTVEAGLAPALGTAATIDGSLDPETTRLCRGTPISTALERAGQTLALGTTPAKNVVLVSDGKQLCPGDPVAQTKALAKDGVRVYAIGFGQSASEPASHQSLNRIACAGQTAAGFAANCVDDGSGGYDPVAPSGAALYIAAEDGPALTAALEDQIAGQLCCDSACPPS